MKEVRKPVSLSLKKQVEIVSRPKGIRVEKWVNIFMENNPGLYPNKKRAMNGYIHYNNSKAAIIALSKTPIVEKNKISTDLPQIYHTGEKSEIRPLVIGGTSILFPTNSVTFNGILLKW